MSGDCIAAALCRAASYRTASKRASHAAERPVRGALLPALALLALVLGADSALSEAAERAPNGKRLTAHKVDSTDGTQTRKLPDSLIVDAREYPWSAIGRLNTGGRGYCTAVLVDEYHVLTDAHCLYYRTEGRWWQPNELHFVAGYQRDSYVTHAKVRSYEIAPGYRAHGGISLASILNNWALVRLNKPLGQEAGWLGLKNLDRKLIRKLKKGRGAFLQAGYRRGAQHAITLGLDCRPDGFFASENRIGNRCQLKPGRAGLPFLVYMDGRFNLVANHVISSIKRQAPRRGALASAPFRKKLLRGGSRAPAAAASASPTPRNTIADLLDSLGHGKAQALEPQARIERSAIRSFEREAGLAVTGDATVALLGRIIESAK